VEPTWITKTDPVHHPVRFLGSIWQQQMKARFGVERPLTPKEYGQLKTLRQRLGELTQPLIEWIVDPVNWWHFCQEVRAGWKTIFVPDYPDIDFLLGRRGVALRVMRAKLSNSSEGAEFVKKVDEREFREIKTLLLAAYVEGDTDKRTKVESAKTLVQMQRTFIELMEASEVDSQGA
jgi:hypothetical protein